MNQGYQEMNRNNEVPRLVAVEPGDPVARSLNNVNDIVSELHTMLADYAPTWYSEAQHIRTEQALTELNRLLSSRFRVSPA